MLVLEKTFQMRSLSLLKRHLKLVRQVLMNVSCIQCIKYVQNGEASTESNSKKIQ